MAFLTPSGVRRIPEVSGLSNKPLSEPPALYFISSFNFLQEPPEKRRGNLNFGPVDLIKESGLLNLDFDTLVLGKHSLSFVLFTALLTLIRKIILLTSVYR
ncbi:hypothetical protein NPIL_350491 [Nephila pilipes]|uniref:Uncharacterized protein n=1 Tax=Nephila pilipes TaxID=299642 RepID=A0A8X6MAT0_NEPPI|nr:hypothetical protein NPIL_350491 [Nephila pilipes]